MPDPIVINLNTAEIVANGQPLTVSPGEVTVSLDTAKLLASGQPIDAFALVRAIVKTWTLPGRSLDWTLDDRDLRWTVEPE